MMNIKTSVANRLNEWLASQFDAERPDRTAAALYNSLRGTIAFCAGESCPWDNDTGAQMMEFCRTVALCQGEHLPPTIEVLAESIQDAYPNYYAHFVQGINSRQFAAHLTQLEQQ